MKTSNYKLQLIAIELTVITIYIMQVVYNDEVCMHILLISSQGFGYLVAIPLLIIIIANSSFDAAMQLLITMMCSLEQFYQI